MSRSTTRVLILLTALLAAIVHLVILNINFMRAQGQPDLLFTLNGLGYFAFIVAFFFRIPVVERYQGWVNWGFLIYTAVTLAAWVAIGARTALGFITALDEVLLIAFLWLHNRTE
jgi:hypothetical protein